MFCLLLHITYSRNFNGFQIIPIYIYIYHFPCAKIILHITLINFFLFVGNMLYCLFIRFTDWRRWISSYNFRFLTPHSYIHYIGCCVIILISACKWFRITEGERSGFMFEYYYYPRLHLCMYLRGLISIVWYVHNITVGIYTYIYIYIICIPISF